MEQKCPYQLSHRFYGHCRHKTCNMKLMIKCDSCTVKVLFLAWFDFSQLHGNKRHRRSFEPGHTGPRLGGNDGGKSFFSDPGRGSSSGMQQWLREQTSWWVADVGKKIFQSNVFTLPEKPLQILYERSQVSFVSKTKGKLSPPNY